MNTSELITVHHLAKKAIIYIRQSTPRQQISNQESLRLQYALKQRALNLGWQEEDIEIIDDDLGLSGAAVQHREGFKEMLTNVTLGQVGMILSFEVTRLSRNCSDWYPLLDLCGFKGCLIADSEGIYDPATPNGRLLLGLKGQLSELELHMIRTRLTAGILNKAQRGELALKLPIGFIRDEQDRVHKDPNLEIQHRIDLIFTSFLRLKSANKVLRFFNENNLLIPRANRYNEVVWKKPKVASIILVLKNPAYAGAFAYGRSRIMRKSSNPQDIYRKRLPLEEWKILVKDKYPAYIDWETFLKIQDQVKDNYAEYDRNKTRGIPREGEALLHGITYCGECGRKMVVQYKDSSRYICNSLRQQYGVPVCQSIPAIPVDAKVVEAFFEALSPVELDAYEKTLKQQKQVQEKIDQAGVEQTQRLQYQADLARRQYDKVDPGNRLVASELERRWETALRELKKAEEKLSQKKENTFFQPLSPELKSAFQDIGAKLPDLWNSETLATQNKKALLRCLMDKVVIHRSARDMVRVRIVWKGEATTTFETPIKVNAFSQLSFAKEMEQLILQLTSEGVSDEEIARDLTSRGYRSPSKPYVQVSTVMGIRLKHRIFRKKSQSHPRNIPGQLTVPQLSKMIEVTPHWIYRLINKGTIQIVKDQETGLYLFPDKKSTVQKLKKLKEGKNSKLKFQ